jgi:hypothetical protein
MEAIKKNRIRRNGGQLVVDLPDSFKADIVDVIIFASEVDTEMERSITKIADLPRMVLEPMTEYEIDKQLKELRNEWNRDI